LPRPHLVRKVWPFRNAAGAAVETRLELPRLARCR
jgi:hypothetical protein